MDAFKNIVLILIALLLIIQIVDRSREPEQIGELKKSLGQARTDFQRMRSNQNELLQQNDELIKQTIALTAALEAFQQGFQTGITVRNNGGSTPPTPNNNDGDNAENTQANTSVEKLDGKPRLGENFLLPYDKKPFSRAKVGGEIRRFASEPDGLNRVLTSMGATADVYNMVTDSLCTARPEHPELWNQGVATSVVITDDWKTFTFKLRKGITYHIPPIAYEEGKEWLQEEVELTAHDFVFYVETINNPDVQSPHLKPYHEEIASIEAIDDYTLVVKWNVSEYTNINSTLGLRPLPRHVYTRDESGNEVPAADVGIVFNEHWFDKANQLIGTGPYMLESFEPSNEIRFKRNSNYWGITDHFETVFWDLSAKAPEPQLLAFKNNQVHYIGLRPNQYKAEILDGHEERFAQPEADNPKAGRNGSFGWEKTGSNRWYGICWNTKRSKLEDPRVRRALAHAYDFDRISSEVFFGLAQRSTGPTHPSSPYFNNQTPAYTFDLKKAAALLDEAGWVDSDADGWRDKEINGERVKLSLGVIYYALARTWANLVSLFADDCKKIGVEIVPNPVEDTEWVERADNRNFDGFMIVWSSGLDVDFKQLWHSSTANEPKSSNYAGWSNAEADPQIEALRATFLLDDRIAIARKVADIIYREQPYLFISVGQSVLAWHNKQYENGENRELLNGIEYGFDNYHPLQSSESSRWFIEK